MFPTGKQRGRSPFEMELHRHGMENRVREEASVESMGSGGEERKVRDRDEEKAVGGV